MPCHSIGGGTYKFPYLIVEGQLALGNKGSVRKPMSCQSSSTLGGQMWKDCCTLSTWPQVGFWLCEATEPFGGGEGWVDGQGAVQGLWASQRPEIAGSQSPASHTGYCGSVENRMGAPGQLSQPWS